MRNGFKRLIPYAIACGIGFTLGIWTVGKWITGLEAEGRGETKKEKKAGSEKKENKWNKKKNTSDEKTMRREYLLDNWLMAKKYGTPMEKILLKKGIRRVAIYGTQYIGIRLYHELKDTPIEVVCSYDRNPKQLIYGVPHYKKPDAEAHPADAVIVANYFLYDEIKKVLLEAGYANIIALDELIIQMLEDKQNEPQE